MKLLSSIAMVLVLGSVAACGAKKDTGATTGSGSGSADPGSGSAATMAAGSGSGSATSGSGSGSGSGSAMAADAGSGSAAMAGSGSGSAMAGSGSGSAMAGSGSAAMAGSGSGSAMAAGSDAGSGDDMAFDKLSHDDKVKLMKEHVTVDMKKAFQDYDAKKFAGFNCKTCHGKDPAKAKFKMPNPELPKLDFAAIKAGKQNPKMAKFMDDVVEPKMVELLGAKKFDMATMKGFGCLGCHTQKQ